MNKQKERKKEGKSHHFLSYREYAGGRVGTTVGGGVGGCVRAASVEVGTQEQDAQPFRNVYSLVARL